MSEQLTRPIVGIKNRTAQEVFDIMCDRVRLSSTPSPSLVSGDVVEAVAFAAQVESELSERAPSYSIYSVERPHFDRAILALAGLRRAIAALSVSDPLVRQLVEALEQLEAANDALCATRSQETYLSMIDRDKAETQMQALDDARLAARSALRSAREQGNG